jgi:DNA invertase Pin-like site-specific DNA recombinase
MSKTIRCAIYTRKSHEEGLDQDFNSLDAQREAGEAYIKSQKHEGWQLIQAQYNDGGFSGGTMQRPALQQLLADIKSGTIDIRSIAYHARSAILPKWSRYLMRITSRLYQSRSLSTRPPRWED